MSYQYEKVKEQKLCKYCKTEIPKDAKICPNCRKKQKKKWPIILIVVILLFALLGSCGEEEENSPKKTGEVETNSNTKEEAKNRFNVGDVVETKDLKITFVSAGEYTSDNEFIQPKDGNVFYKFSFEFENISDSDQYVSSYDWDGFADGYAIEQKFIADEELDATLPSGMKTKGDIFFEVPADAEKVEIHYNVNFFSEKRIIFDIK